VGSLAGILPAGPGHSHQAVRDISALGAIPGLAIAEPSCNAEVNMLLEYAIEALDTSLYLRLISLPSKVPYKLPATYRPILGKGVKIKDGDKFIFISYGIFTLPIIYLVAEKMEKEYGIKLGVINLPWLNYIDETWLLDELKSSMLVISIENHFSIGGQGDRIADILSTSGDSRIVYKKIASLNSIPQCGSNGEVIRLYGLEVDSIQKKVLALIREIG
jgi:transketolase